jgi:hypothetical protein
VGTSGNGPDGADDGELVSSAGADEDGPAVEAVTSEVVGEPAAIDVDVVTTAEPVVSDGSDFAPSEPHPLTARLNARADAAATTMVRRAPRNDTRVILTHPDAPDNPFDPRTDAPPLQPESG